MNVRKVVTLCVSILLVSQFGFALQRQSNADYRARREALAKKVKDGVIVVFAPMEAEGPNAIYGFRQDDKINERALLTMFKQIIANNRAGGWRKVKGNS